jgi:coenzyme F420 hydrogenase subunit beta
MKFGGGWVDVAAATRRTVACMTTIETPADAAPKKERWTAQWKELYSEVITNNLCTGCAGCVVTCPHDVIGYEHEEGKYIPFHLEEELGLDNCIHGEKGCTTCTRACPRFRAWEPAADMHLFGRVREPDEMAGIWRQLYLTRASDEMVNKMGQDGGLVSAMLIWLREHDYIDAALVSGVEEDDAWKAKPAVVSTREEILATAGSRYTYCANPLALREAQEKGFKRLALVGMGCQTSSPPVMWDRKAGKVGKSILFNIGLLCSKTFDDAIFEELFEAKYGLKKQDMVKMNIKGAFQIWMKDGSYHEINLKECHAWTREGCKTCPDFAAEHSDVATGGIGDDNDWTLTIVRTELGEEVIERMIADGSILAKPAQTDETAMRLLRLLSIVSRRRWPEGADLAPAIGVPPPKKKAAAVTAEPAADAKPDGPKAAETKSAEPASEPKKD